MSILTVNLGLGQNEPAKTRTLIFPSDRSIGEIYVGVPISTPYDDVEIYGGKQFKKIGPAKGEVELPGDRLIRLEVSSDSSSDLSPLASLPPDSVHFLSFKNAPSFENQFQHIKHLTGIRWLVLRSCPVNDEEFAHLAGFTNLEFLRLSVYGFADKGFGITDKSMTVIQRFEKLRVLSLRDNPITDAGLVALSNCEDLETLGLAGSNVDGSGLENLMMLPKLESLSFGAYEKGAPINDESMKLIVQLERLRHLDLSGTAITDAGLKHIRRLKNLETLTLDYTNVTENGLANLEGLTKLKKLRFYMKQGKLGDAAAIYLGNLPSLEKITAHFNLTTEGIRSLSKLTKLKSFDFSGGLTDEALVEVGKMKGMESLSIQNCEDVTDAGIAHLASLTNLERFSIRSTIATSACIETIIQLPKLTSLKLSFEQNADAPYLWPAMDDWKLLGKMTDLEYLELDGMLLDDQYWPIFEKLEKLEELKVENYLPLDAGFFKSVSMMPSLKSVSFNEVSKSGIGGIGELAKTKLRYLEVRGPVGPEDLQVFAKLPALRILRVRTTEQITDDQIAEFKRSVPNLNQFSHSDVQNTWFDLGSDGIVRRGSPSSLKRMRALEGKEPPALSAIGLPGGDKFDLKTYKGKIVIVHFWNGWTLGPRPRPDEVHVRNVMAEFADRDVQVVGVHSTELAERMPAFVKKHGIDWPCVVDKDNLSKAAWGSPQRNGLFLIDRAGKVQMAGVYQGDLKRAIEKMLEEK
ncbi:MAG: redoxin domain-containing protein [Mariniblastus sp.]